MPQKEEEARLGCGGAMTALGSSDATVMGALVALGVGALGVGALALRWSREPPAAASTEEASGPADLQGHGHEHGYAHSHEGGEECRGHGPRVAPRPNSAHAHSPSQLSPEAPADCFQWQCGDWRRRGGDCE